MAEIKRVNGDYTINTLGTGSDFSAITNSSDSDINLTTAGANSDVNITVTNDVNIVAPGGTSIISNVEITGNLVVTGTIDFRNVKNRIFVSKNGDDNNDGRSWDKAKRTIKNACQTAQSLISSPPVDEDRQLENGHVSIFVASGDYTEDCPIAVPAGCAIIGDNLRSVTVRPAVARSNVFTLGSNCYVWGLTVRGHQLYPSALDITPEGYAGANGKHLPRSTTQVGFAFSFTPGEVIRVSPYIQNCSSISGSGIFGNPDYVPGGGGILVDPSVCAEGNRINSIVLDAFTQINQGGIGCKVVGRGYMQLVSFFVNFCQFGVLCVDGGHVTLLNSNCSFGNYAFWAEGKRTLVREPDAIDPSNPGVTYQEVIPYKEAREYLQTNRLTLQNDVVTWVDSDVVANYTTTVTNVATGTNLLTATNSAKLYLGMPVRFSGTLFGGLNNYTTYYVNSISGSDFTIRNAAGSVITFGSNASGTMTVAFYYDSGKCKRDVGYIIDALIEDLKTDSVIYSRRAGTAYWSGVTSLVEGQVTQTVDAISELESLLETAFTGDLEKTVALTPIKSSLATIKDFIKYGPNKPFEQARTLIDKNRTYIGDQLIIWINTQVSLGTGYWSGFTYNQTKCRRDVDYLIDAIISDLVTGTGRASRTAGNAYWKGTVDIPLPSPVSMITGQVSQTVDAINELRNKILDVIKNVDIGQPVRNESIYPDGDFAESPMLRYFATITGIVGSPTGPDKDDLLISPLYESARRLMTLNKEFIKKETVAYVNNELSLSVKIIGSDSVTNRFTCVSTRSLSEGKPIRFVNDPKGDPLDPDVFGGVTANTVYYVKQVVNSTQFTISETLNGAVFTVTQTVNDNTMYAIFYSQEKCERDVGYIIDAVVSDLATNSQESTLMAGNAYWRGASSISADFITQLPDTLSAIDYAKRLALQIIKSDTTPPIGDSALLEPRDIFFKSDGTSVYILGGVGPKIYQYTCSPAWTTSGLTYVNSFDLSDKEITPQGMYLTSTKLYVIGTGSGDDVTDGRLVLEYDITGWNVATASYLQQKNLGALAVGSGFVDNPSGLSFKPDGTIMYVLGSSDAKVYSYALSPAWDVTTATYLASFTIAEDNLPTGITFKNDGSRMYVTGSTNDTVIDYKLNPAYDITTAVFMESISVSDREQEITGVQFRSDNGAKMYIIGLDNDSIIEYNLLTAWDITSIEYASSTPVGYYSTPYQTAEKQKFVARITGVDSTENRFICDPTYGTLYLKANQEIKFAAGLDGSGLSGLVFGGVSAGTTYYIKTIVSATEFTISDTINAAGVAGSIKALAGSNPTGSMVVAPSGASAAFDVEKNFNTIINIISNGFEELEEEFGSLVEATGYTLSYAGAGIDYSKLSKGQGGVGLADPNKYTIELSGGRVFITATDEKGDFYVGKVTPAAAGQTPRPLFRINQETGAIDGRAFYQSIFGFMAPFVMALTRRK